MNTATRRAPRKTAELPPLRLANARPSADTHGLVRSDTLKLVQALGAMLVLNACIFGAFLLMSARQHRAQEVSAPAASADAAPDAGAPSPADNNRESVEPDAAASETTPPPAVPSEREAYRQGFRAGRDFWNSPAQRRARKPNGAAFDEIVRLHSVGKPPTFADGFRDGFADALEKRPN